jgi:hypothetical protein
MLDHSLGELHVPTLRKSRLKSGIKGEAKTKCSIAEVRK